MADQHPTLASCAGTYREVPVPVPLARHFSCLWSHTVPAGRYLGPVAVLPDGCVDLLWMEGRLIVAGPDRCANLTRLAPGSTVTGIRFRPGAATNWLGVPMSALVGLRLDLGELWGRRARDLLARLGEAGDPPGRRQRLQDALSHLAPAVEAPAPAMATVFETLRGPTAGDGITVVRRRLDISERSLRRHCHAAFGFGAKRLERILRLQRFLTLARNSTAPRLPFLAQDAGYADQAHLTREVRELAGLSPSSVLRQIQPA